MIINAAKYRLGTQHCYVIYDLHIDSISSTTGKDQFLTLLTLGQEHNLTFIVEDMFDYDRSNQEFETILPQISAALEKSTLLFPGIDNTIVEYSGLLGSVQALRTGDVAVINAEFRQAYLLNSWYMARGKTPEGIVAFQQLTASFKVIMEEIQQYRDTPALDLYYKNVLASAQQSFSVISDANRLLTTPQEFTEFLTEFWNCMIIMLDARMVHYAYLQTGTGKDYVVYAGAEHAMAVANALPTMGYVLVQEYGDKAIIEKCIEYRNRSHTLRIVPATGLRAIAKNIITSWQQQRSKKQLAKKYKKVLAKAASLPLGSLFE